MFADRTVLATGGTESFGRRFISILLNYAPRRRIVSSRDELKQSEIQSEPGPRPASRTTTAQDRSCESMELKLSLCAFWQGLPGSK